MKLRIYRAVLEDVEIRRLCGGYQESILNKTPLLHTDPDIPLEEDITVKTYDVKTFIWQKRGGWREECRYVIADDMLNRVLDCLKIERNVMKEKIESASFWMRLKYLFTKVL